MHTCCTLRFRWQPQRLSWAQTMAALRCVRSRLGLQGAQINSGMASSAFQTDVMSDVTARFARVDKFLWHAMEGDVVYKKARQTNALTWQISRSFTPLKHFPARWHRAVVGRLQP